MEQTIRRLASQIDSTRLAQMTFDLAQILSPTRDTGRIATWYAGYLSDIGLSPDIQRDIPDGPNVIARIQGAGSGPTLTFLSHMDHKPLDHPPAYQESGMIYGRGVADPKSGLAAMTEAARVLVEAGLRLKGDLVLVAHSLHEYPAGRREGLDRLLQQGMLGNAIVCTSGPHNYVPVVGRGSAVFEFRVKRGGDARHELSSPRELPNPILESRLVLDRLVRWNEEVSRISWPYVGPESVHVGMIEGGDAHDRLPLACRLRGTRRFGPGKSEHEVQAELERIRRDVQVRSLAEIELETTIVGMGYRLHEQEPIVEALRRAYELIVGRRLALGGYLDTGDASLTAGVGGIPTVCHGANRERLDADLEYVSLRDIVRAARVYLAAALLYLGVDED
jgi:acetylornithine deacetylase/succinyl-diaminopimelate desuccinylase-like protein